MAGIMKSLVLALCATASVQALNMNLRIGSGGRTINDFKREIEKEANAIEKRDYDPEKLYPKRYFTMPVDHFPNKKKYEPHTDHTFENRYWFDDTYYKPGGPVIVLQSGETNGLNRLPYIQKGILRILSKATGGMSVVLEHRYYGYSFPTRYLTKKDLRFLTTEQAMADEAYFAQNIKFPGHEDDDLTSKSTPWIAYGGSYAGAFVAFLRVTYPDVFWGAISSSGVTKAIWDYWAYNEPASHYGPPSCIAAQKMFIHMADNILIDKADNKDLVQQLKGLFGMPNVTHTPDFANQLGWGVGWWQSLNWDPEVSSPEFYDYCNNLTSTDVLYPKHESKRSDAEAIMTAGGYEPNKTVVNQLLNYVGYTYMMQVDPCTDSGSTQDQCFTNLNKTHFEQTGQDQSIWRSWAWQYCTEWGYLQTGSGVPKDQLSLVSRTLTLDYQGAVCRLAFDIYGPPDVEEVNKYGAYDIKHSRLAIIDGQWDPWRPVTPHGFHYGAPHRKSTTSEPFILISKALHHYDENGLFPNETTPTLPPQPVKDAQAAEVEFVKAWLDEWNAQKRK